MSDENLPESEIEAPEVREDLEEQEQLEPTPVVQVGVHRYDFRRPERISKDRKRSLQAMYELLAKGLESWLTGRVQDQIELRLDRVEQLTFGELITSLPSPCASYIVDVSGSGQQGLIEFGHEFAYYCVDRLLGGVGKPVIPDRSLTAIERELVQIVAERVAHRLSDVWRDYVSLEMTVAGFESIPEMLQAANREDPVLLAYLEVKMGELASTILLCLPFAALEKFFTGTSNRRHQVAQGTPEERRAERGHLEDSVRAAKLVLGARLPEIALSIKELRDLEVGGLLTTGLSLDTELHVYVSGQRRFTAQPGRSGKRLAVRVNELLKPEPDDIIDPERERI